MRMKHREYDYIIQRHSHTVKLTLNEFPSVEINCDTVRHVGILDGTGGVGGNETNKPEDDSEDEGSDG